MIENEATTKEPYVRRTAVSKWAMQGMSFTQFIESFHSKHFNYAATHPKLTPFWSDLFAARSVLTSLVRLKVLAPPYAVLVTDLDPVARSARQAEGELTMLESRTQSELTALANEQYEGLDYNCTQMQMILARHLKDAILIITSLSNQHREGLKNEK